MQKAYKFRLYPNKEQETLIQKTFGSCRFVFNRYLDKRMTLYKEENKTLNYNACGECVRPLFKVAVFIETRIPLL